MKRYLTFIFGALAIIILIIGLLFEARWSGAASWGLAFISLIMASLFTKHIKGN